MRGCVSVCVFVCLLVSLEVGCGFNLFEIEVVRL